MELQGKNNMKANCKCIMYWNIMLLCFFALIHSVTFMREIGKLQRYF
jgi:hypothetical protein